MKQEKNNIKILENEDKQLYIEFFKASLDVSKQRLTIIFSLIGGFLSILLISDNLDKNIVFSPNSFLFKQLLHLLFVFFLLLLYGLKGLTANLNYMAGLLGNNMFDKNLLKNELNLSTKQLLDDNLKELNNFNFEYFFMYLTICLLGILLFVYSYFSKNMYCSYIIYNAVILVFVLIVLYKIKFKLILFCKISSLSVLLWIFIWTIIFDLFIYFS